MKLTKVQKARLEALCRFLSGGDAQASTLTALALARDSSALLSLLTRIGETPDPPRPPLRALVDSLLVDPQVGRAAALISYRWAQQVGEDR